MCNTGYGRKLRGKTVKGNEAGLKKEPNKELTSKRLLIDLTSLPTTHRLAIELRSLMNPNSLPKLQFTHPITIAILITITFTTVHTRYTLTPANSSGHAGSSCTGHSDSLIFSSNTTSSAHAKSSVKTSSIDLYNQWPLIRFLAHVHAKVKGLMPLLGISATTNLGGADFHKLIKAYGYR